MDITWHALWHRSHEPLKRWLKAEWLKTAGLIAAVLLAVHSGVVRPLSAFQGIAQSKASGLAAIDANRHWLVPLPKSVDNASLAEGIVGGVPGGFSSGTIRAVSYLSTPDDSADRKLVRTASIDLLVKHPAEAAEKIRSLTERVGGFLVKSQTNGAQDATNASLVIRVPVAHYSEAAVEIRSLGIRVESEQMEAEDVTRHYVDQQAHLRNLRAQETQYLNILKQAKTVKDTLAVSEKLNGVRGEIEQQQAEFEALSKQVENVAISVSLHSEREATVFGVRWRPLYELKLAMAGGLEGLADYATSILSFVFYLPAILLWLVTILVGASLGWKALRLGVRVLFAGKGTARVST
jgi:hypothetical protein